MTRTGDIAPPTVTPHPLDPGAPIYGWPYRPVIALERLPAAAYTWDDDDPAVVWDGAYLTATVGTVTTPDPGPVPAQYHFVVDVTSPATGQSGAKDLAAQFEGPGREWRLVRESAPTAGQFGNIVYPSGTTSPVQVVYASEAAVTPPAGTRERFAVSFDRQAAQTVARIYRPAAAGWTEAATKTTATTAVTDASSALRIGGWSTDTTTRWPGRIYSVEMRTGLVPGAGTVVWRFDAGDYPGTGTSYVDPRGRTWTLTAAAAITATPYVYDAPLVESGFTDASCDFHAVEIDPGDADDLYLFPAVSCTVTLDNRSGEYTPWSADGRLVYWAPGRRLAVFTVDGGGVKDWLFSGRVASWTSNADGTVTVTAFDGFAWLAQDLGGKWTPGTAGQSVGARMAAIMTAAGYPDRVDVDAGTVTLTAPELDATTSPLMAAQRVALSDGGLFYGDADGSLDYRGRLWRSGRPDQPRTYTVADNVCTADVVVWDPEAAADDERLATDVRLVNTANLVATAALAAGSSLWAGDARYRLAHPDPDQWTTQTEGDTLAGYLLAQQSTPAMALSRFVLYVQDPAQPTAWELAVRTRRGDRLEVLHEYVDPSGGPAILDLFAVVLGVAHSITPEQWVAELSLSRTVDWSTPEQWDVTAFRWDEPATPGTNPANVWRH